MINLKKSLKLAGALAIVLGAASPMLATSASAAPYGHGEMDRGHDHDAYRDRNRMPPPRFEHRPQMPRHGHYTWRKGHWAWQHGQWIWVNGIWFRF